jgi:glutathionyl-hydroquinone reductase
MGMLLNGIWHQEAPPMAAASGSFVRSESEFRNRVTRAGSSGSNRRGVTPLGPELDFSAPHDRGRSAKAA